MINSVFNCKKINRRNRKIVSPAFQMTLQLIFHQDISKVFFSFFSRKTSLFGVDFVDDLLVLAIIRYFYTIIILSETTRFTAVFFAITPRDKVIFRIQQKTFFVSYSLYATKKRRFVSSFGCSSVKSPNASTLEKPLFSNILK